jgi:hypothetical protein
VVVEVGFKLLALLAGQERHPEVDAHVDDLHCQQRTRPARPGSRR